MSNSLTAPSATRATHPLWLRLVHWANVPLLTLMIWSGLLIYWANPAYPPFFPDSFFDSLNLAGHLAQGIWVHMFIAWIFVLNGVVYIGASLATGRWRDVLPNKSSLRRLGPTLIRELTFRAHAPETERFNPAQRLAYTGVWALIILGVLSGFAIYKPVQLGPLAALFGGYEGARLVHFVVMLLFVLFTLVHVLQVVRAGWKSFRAMVVGWE